MESLPISERRVPRVETLLGRGGDYHYGGHISGLPSELDLYGGLSAGYAIYSDNYDNDFDDIEESRPTFIAQAGARWYFHPNWAANAEVSTGWLTGLEVGLSYKF